jgi:hypothetical protein
VSAPEILSELHRCGVHLEALNGELRYRARKGALTPELRQAMALHKADLIKLLATPQRNPPTTGYGLCPGQQNCAGCYAIPGGRFIHPPKISEEWQARLTRRQPKKGNAIQLHGC